MTNSQPDYERWAELEEQLAEAKRLLEVKLGNTIYRKLANLEEELAKVKCSEDQLMLVIERQDANYERMLKKEAELETALAEKQEEINRLHAIPLAPEPDLYDPGWKTWRDCVQHYKAHLKEQK